MTKTFKTAKVRLAIVSVICLISLLASSINVIGEPEAAHAEASFSFIHPGMLFTQEDLDVMKTNAAAGKSPWADGFKRMQANQLASLNYTPKFHSTVYRNDAVYGNQGNADLQFSGSAALFDAVQWYVTGNQAYADKAIQILNGWSNTLTSIQGRDQQLAASLYGYKLLNAAEILRYSGSGWSSADMDKFTSMMRSVFLPIVSTWGWVNGGWANGNWDAADALFYMCFGIWSDDEELYNEGVEYYKHGEGNGSLTHYIQTDYGQAQESGRDQGHTQGGIALLAMSAQVGWNQRTVSANGADMYSYPDNSYLLLKGVEYTAKYNLGYDVPYTPLPGVGYDKPWWPNEVISPIGRGTFSAIYQQIYNFYKYDIGVQDSALAYTKQIIDRTKFETFTNDQVSYGELVYAADPDGYDYKASQWRTTTVTIGNTAKVLKSPGTGTLINVADGTSTVKANGMTAGLSNEFEMQYMGESNNFAFKSLLSNKYLTVTASGAVVASGDTVGPAQTFFLTYTGNSNGTLKSLANNMYVSMDPTTFELSANAGSVVNDNGRFYIYYPIDPPVTMAALSPAAPEGQQDWYTHPVTLTLTANDSVLDTAKTEYSIDGGATWNTYTGPVTFDKDGQYTVVYGSSDVGGGVELPKTVSFKLDIAPVINVTSPGAAIYMDSDVLKPQFTVTDDTYGDGQIAVTALLDGSPVQAGSEIPLYSLTLGKHTFTVTATNPTGSSLTKSVDFEVATSIAALKALVQGFAANGLIDNRDIAGSLIEKLELNQLTDFINLVKAQSGKHIDKSAAGYLLRDAQAIMQDK
ncbi:alginate lyase family protein [Paenibacillus sp. sptzw28]|uniref:OmpL47-type beta-barrel domain-containing protein n=1 Tax=Paenibacillus sp. sptzw28 TaxID=715179 RepID=UPI001C6E84E2|nr:alginate lyase family protein [Paenibacillus sp. sptzw28]QYR22866.1 alginate lyase family protein [Paenibacillus sp. sptzw28]